MVYKMFKVLIWLKLFGFNLVKEKVSINEQNNIEKTDTICLLVKHLRDNRSFLFLTTWD